jgi:FSR family fosmidomycin resistance protein-like MFS transporter
MAFTLSGLMVMAWASSYVALLCGVALVGTGSAIFHPEASRVARMASGGRHGFAQSLFQVGGNVGSAIGPLLAAALIVPHGQGAVAFVGVLPVLAIALMTPIGFWYRARRKATAARAAAPVIPQHSNAVIARTLLILIVLMFSKFVYMAGFSSYYVFYLIEKFGLSVQEAQIHLFVFLAAVAVGTIIGGPLGDRFGRRGVIWFSILGALPFALIVPWVGLYATTALSAVAGLILASAFPAIVVYGQELLPGKVGAVSGLFFGFAFGAGGLGGALLGALADHTGIVFVYKVSAFLPAIGILAFLLPKTRR